MIVLPLVSFALDRFFLHSPLPVTALLGKWFVFWAAGVRLFTAGLKQFFQPEFTAKRIFHMTTGEALPVVRELGIANIAVGAAGIISSWKPTFILPIALIAAIFYGVVGIIHTHKKGKSKNENIAMVTDLWVSLVLVAYLVTTLAG